MWKSKKNRGLDKKKFQKKIAEFETTYFKVINHKNCNGKLWIIIVSAAIEIITLNFIVQHFYGQG